LDEFEQLNIEKTIQWTLTRKFKKDDIRTEDFVNLVHKKMYGDVWAWAGEFRRTNKNIGVDRCQVAIEYQILASLLLVL
jgi:fido (protein-threonine AMPylation protein)